MIEQNYTEKCITCGKPIKDFPLVGSEVTFEDGKIVSIEGHCFVCHYKWLFKDFLGWLTGRHK